MKVLCVLDGDCREQDIEDWISQEAGGDATLKPDWILLPGNQPPEMWVTEQLLLPNYRNNLASQFNCSIPEANALIQAISTEIGSPQSRVPLERQTGIDAVDCLRRVMRSVAFEHPQLDELRCEVGSELD